jgi:hypothetical protein
MQPQMEEASCVFLCSLCSISSWTWAKQRSCSVVRRETWKGRETFAFAESFERAAEAWEGGHAPGRFWWHCCPVITLRAGSKTAGTPFE